MAARLTFGLIALFTVGLSLAPIDNPSWSQTPSSETVDLLRAETANTISFREKVAFIGPSGEEIIPSIGTYKVEPLGPSALRLIPFGKEEAFVIKAQSRKHDEDIGTPIALMAIDDKELFHVVLLLPEQQGLEAIGFSTRGRFRASPELLSATQLHEALMRKKAGQP